MMKFFKARWNHGAAAGVLIILSVIQGWRWGTDILQLQDEGNAFILGGPSLWYATALFPTMVGIGYLISWLGSLGGVEIHSEDSIIEISEKKLFRTQKI